MNNVANKNASLEILVSTKGQDNTDFINRMFKTVLTEDAEQKMEILKLKKL